MSKRSLNVDLPDGIPELVIHYQYATKRVFGHEVYISSKLYGRFLAFSDDLKDLGYSVSDYANTVVQLLKPWALRKGLDDVPVNAFLGNWALERYEEIVNSEYVSSDDADPDLMLESELVVAKFYIDSHVSGECLRFRDCVKQLMPMLNKEWLEAYKNIDDRSETQALDLLEEFYGVTETLSYNDIIERLVL